MIRKSMRRSVLSFAIATTAISFLQAQPEKRRKTQILDTFYPDVTHGQDLWISADLLVMVPDEDAVVLTNRKTNLFDQNNITLQPALDTSFRWDVGARIGFGYIFPERKWDMAVNWLLYNSSTRKRSSTNMNISEGMFPVWSLSDDIIPYDWIAFAKMNWSLGVNLLDLDFGYSWRYKRLFLRPYVGLRSAWIDQDFDVQYGGGIFANGPDLYAMSNNAGYDSITMRNDYWGLGPRLGFEPQLNLGKGFRLYGNVSGSYELGYFYLLQDEVYLSFVRFHKRSQSFAARWILDAAAGFLWETFICKERFALTFKLGWEYHLFFHQFQLQKDQFGIVPDNRNLSLNGGAFSGRFSF